MGLLSVNKNLVCSYLIRRLSPEAIRALVTVKEYREVGRLWTALLGQCQSTNKHTVRKIYNELINVDMRTTKSIIDYKG